MLKIKKINNSILWCFLFLFCVACGEVDYEARTRYSKRNNISHNDYDDYKERYIKKNNRYYNNYGCNCCCNCSSDCLKSEELNNSYNDKRPKNYSGCYKVGNPYEINGKMYYPREDKNYREVGLASWYGEEFHNRKTANGEVFDMYGITAAHKTLPLPSMVRVTNLENGRSIKVRVNDRGPFVDGRIIDLSYGAAKKLDATHLKKGLLKVKVEYLDGETRKMLKDYGLK